MPSVLFFRKLRSLVRVAHALDAMYPDFEYSILRPPDGVHFLRLPAEQGREAMLLPKGSSWWLVESYTGPAQEPNFFALARLRRPIIVARRLMEELAKPMYTRY